MKATMPGILLVGAAAVVLALLGHSGGVSPAEASPSALRDVAPDLAGILPLAADPQDTQPEDSTDAPAREAKQPAPHPSSQRLLQSPEAWSQPFLKRPTRVIPRKLTPEMTDKLLGIVKDIDPSIAGKFDELRNKDEKQLEHKLLHAHRLFDLIALKEKDPNLYQLKLVELKVESVVNRLRKELREAYRTGPPEKFELIKSKLQAQLRMLFAFRHQARDEYVCRLQDALKRLEDEVAAEREYLSSHIDEIVDEQIAQMLRDAPSSGRPTKDLKLSSLPKE
ncbi:MAG: hypothetical protein GY715_11310 [Planctomycetes bacterium]|nr:hypothetical protein [Planctomycetota bacterium]